ncbi:MAG TPA: phage tail protein, partial [Oceanipulchritudo sp.]|nr:phage tail protein [Oceanipulchritudo sp.]
VRRRMRFRLTIVSLLGFLTAFSGTATLSGITFQLQSEGLSVYFNSLTLGSSTEVIEKKVVGGQGAEVVLKVPGRLKWDNIVLKRGVSADKSLWDWRALVESGDMVTARRNFSIVVFDQYGVELARWEFEAGWPSNLQLESDLVSGAVETLSIAFENFFRAQITLPGNNAPVINLPASFSIAVGETAEFIVSTSDPDNDLVNLTNLLAPVGATFTNGVFTWAVPISSVESSEVVTFKADDQQNATNSTVTSSLTITVPRDFDADAMDDDWEVVWFGSIANSPNTDFDDDGVSNLHEFWAATSPIDPDSVFTVTAITSEAGVVEISFIAEPGMQYQLEVNGSGLDAENWFEAGPVWIETSEVSTPRTLVDENIPIAGTKARFYRIRARRI